MDFYNKTSQGDDPPVLLYAQTGLSSAVHTVKIVNLQDSRVGNYGQLNVSFAEMLQANLVLIVVTQLDHFILTGPASSNTWPAVTAPTFPDNSFVVTGPMDTYHAQLTLGAHSSLNGGDEVASTVLFDTGGIFLYL